jgi:broad specificity phosphatase PhoE
MTSLILVRHGETDWNVEGRYQGQADPPLNERGREQARQTAAEIAMLRPDAIYSSPLKRAWETAQIIAEVAGIPDVIPEPRLKEISQGEWEGMLVTEIQAEYPEEFRLWLEHPWQLKLPGRESLQDLEKRVMDAVNDILVRHRGEKVVIVSHKQPIAIIKIHFQGIPKEKIWEILPPNGGWEIIEVTER